jgi:hypothetical protein
MNKQKIQKLPKEAAEDISFLEDRYTNEMFLDDHYFIIRNRDFEPYLVIQDGIGTSIFDSSGYQYFYRRTPMREFLKSKLVTVIGSWSEK